MVSNLDAQAFRAVQTSCCQRHESSRPGAPGHSGDHCSPLAALAVTPLALRLQLEQVPALALGRVPGQQQVRGRDAAPLLLWLRLLPLLVDS